MNGLVSRKTGTRHQNLGGKLMTSAHSMGLLPCDPICLLPSRSHGNHAGLSGSTPTGMRQVRLLHDLAALDFVPWGTPLASPWSRPC